MVSGRISLAGQRLAIVLLDLGVGGAERQASLLAAFLKTQCAAEVEVWCFSLFGRNREILNRCGIPCLEISPGGRGGPFHRASDLIGFISSARKRRIDLLIPFANHPNRVCGALWPLIGAWGSIWNQRDEGRGITGRPLEGAALRWTSIFACNAASGESFLRHTLGVQPERIVRVRNWVVPSPPEQTPERWRRELGLGAKTPLVLMIGNLHNFKDHPTLFRAWKRVLNVPWPAMPRLLLAGRPCEPTASELKKLAAELRLEKSILFLGEIDDVSGLLSTVELVVHSSRREGCPNAVLETMAAGRPLIATNIIGVREALGDNYPGLIPETDEQALASSIIEALSNPSFRESLAETASLRFEKEFPAQECLRSYARMLLDLLRSRNPRHEGRSR